MTDKMTDSLNKQFQEVLRLRTQSRKTKNAADRLGAECEAEWLKLKEMLRAEPEHMGSQS
jgi:hypothetical protein